MFPGNLLAGLLGLQPKPLFELSPVEAKDSVAVKSHELS
jgi:hypothetical protein